MPPGFMMAIHNNDNLYKKYFNSFETEHYYDTGDAGVMDADGYFYVMARTDDIINVSGVRIATGAIEEGRLKDGFELLIAL